MSASSLDVEAPPDVVWRVLVDLRGRSRWAPVQVLMLTDLRPDAPFTWQLNGVTIRSRFAVVDEGHELTWTGRFLGFKAIDRQTLQALGSGETRVTLEESLAGPFLPVLYPARKLKENHERWLASLKTFVEGAGPSA